LQPWSRLGADVLFHKNNPFLVVHDYYSKWLEIIHLPDQTARTVTFKLHSVFARFGNPYFLVTDNAKMFDSEEFRQFMSKIDCTHVTASARYPQSNGAAEAAVKIAKSILKQEDPFTALQVYRATPVAATGFSPSQLLFGRLIRTSLPTLSSNFEQKSVDRESVRVNYDENKRKSEKYHNQKHGVTPLQGLNVGDSVRIKTDDDRDWSQMGRVDSLNDQPRSYNVRIGNKIVKRNRRHLKLTKSSSQPQAKPLVVDAQDNSGKFNEPNQSVERETNVERGTNVEPDTNIELDINVESNIPETGATNVSSESSQSVEQKTSRAGRKIQKPKYYHDEYP
jgi:hypothetical protein